jgi:hypothetical protein
VLQGRVKVESLGGLGFINRKFVVHNAGEVAWADCKLVRAGRLSAKVRRVLAGRDESVASGDFKVDASVPMFREENKVLVQCTEGEGEFFVSR